MDLNIIDGFIRFLINHKDVAYIILFLGSMFETIMGFSFIIFGELFFLAGSIMAGMGILNIWEVIFVLYIGGILGDSISYFLGFKYGIRIYGKFKKIKLFQKFINDENYTKGVNFFQKRGAISVFFARLLGPISWITPFVAGIYKLNYKKFLFYNILGVIIGIGQFIIVGYFFGKHFDAILNIVSTYIIIIIFLLISVFFLYYFLKKRKLLSRIKNIFAENKKQAISFVAKNFFISIAVLLLLYLLFLFFIFFTGTPEEYKQIPHTQTISIDLNNCKKLQLYYDSNKKNPIQPINIILTSKLKLSDMFGKDWKKNKIFDVNKISFLEYVRLLKNKIPPISSLYFDGFAQDGAYQFKSNSIEKRQHVRFWKFKEKSLNKYYGSISYDDGYSFNFYNYFYTPIHSISKNIDKSRDFFYHYLLSRKDLIITCKYIQTKCKIKDIKGDNEPSEEQMYYTDGKILSCYIKGSKTR